MIKHKKNLIIITIFTVLIFIIIGIGSSLLLHLDGRLPPDILLTTSYLINDIYCFGFIIQFSSAAIAVRDRFAILRETFIDKKIFDDKEVCSFIELHEKLFICIKMINNYLTVQLISKFGFLVSSITFSAYSLVRNYLQDVTMKFILTASNGIWSAFEAYVLIIGISSGSSSSNEIEGFHNTGYEILRNREILSFRSKKNLKLFLDSKGRSSSYFVSAFFDINWRLFLSVSIIDN